MVNFKENCHFSRFQRGPTFSRRGVQLFPRGVQLFQGGGPMPYIACDFPGGGSGPPVSPHPGSAFVI